MIIPLPIALFVLLLNFAAVAPSRSSSSSSLSHHYLRNIHKNNVLQKQQRRRRLQNTTSSGPGTVAVSPYWDESEDYEKSYVHFNESMKEYLKTETDALMRGSPDIVIFTTFPEPDQRIWPLVKGMTLRNHLENKILWARPNYLVTDGLKAKCREMKNNGTNNEHVPVESALCDDHCTHAGRYCHPEPPANLPAQVTGKSLVLEALRRLCIDSYYHASDYKYFRYLENFERAGCLAAPDMTACSLEVIDQIAHLEYTEFADCVGDVNEINSDVINDKLEEQLTAAEEKQILPGTDIPSLYLGGIKYTGGELTTKGIFTEYCDMFHRDDKVHPVSCDICSKCQNVRKCLWTLECDGEPFHAATFLASQGQGMPETPPAPGTATSPAPKPAPVPATLPPGGIATANSATGDSSSNNNNNNNQWQKESSGETDANNQVVLVFFIVALSVSGLSAAFIVLKDRRARKRMADIAASQAHAEGAYRDDGGAAGGYQDTINFHDSNANANFDHEGSTNNCRYADHVEMSPSSPPPPTGAFIH